MQKTQLDAAACSKCMRPGCHVPGLPFQYGRQWLFKRNILFAALQQCLGCKRDVTHPKPIRHEERGPLWLAQTKEGWGRKGHTHCLGLSRRKGHTQCLALRKLTENKQQHQLHFSSVGFSAPVSKATWGLNVLFQIISRDFEIPLLENSKFFEKF